MALHIGFSCACLSCSRTTMPCHCPSLTFNNQSNKAGLLNVSQPYLNNIKLMKMKINMPASKCVSRSFPFQEKCVILNDTV